MIERIGLEIGVILFFSSFLLLSHKQFSWLVLFIKSIYHGKKKCDLRDPWSMLKAHSSCTIENWPCAARAHLPCRNHEESYYHVLIEHQFITVLNGNFVNCVLNGGSSIVQLQFSPSNLWYYAG